MVRMPRLRLVYSAANIEAPLKRELMELTPQHYGHPDDLVSEADRMERLAAARAELVFAISGGDAEALRARGATRVVVAGNGSRIADAPRQHQPPPPGAPVRYGCLGSGYWPNVEGLAAVSRPSLAFLPPGQVLGTLGRIGEGLVHHPAWRRGQAINESRLDDAGFLPEAKLAATMAGMDALILPVFVGGGSMLKAADVLATGRPALISRRASVGYEDVIAASEGLIEVAETADAFRRAWIAMCARPRDSFWNAAVVQKAIGARLSWRERLSEVGPAMTAVLRAEKRGA